MLAVVAFAPPTVTDEQVVVSPTEVVRPKPVTPPLTVTYPSIPPNPWPSYLPHFVVTN